jgi:hypothetical protein
MVLATNALLHVVLLSLCHVMTNVTCQLQGPSSQIHCHHGYVDFEPRHGISSLIVTFLELVVYIYVNGHCQGLFPHLAIPFNFQCNTKSSKGQPWSAESRLVFSMTTFLVSSISRSPRASSWAILLPGSGTAGEQIYSPDLSV